MDDKEKILRWNLIEAKSELNEPIDMGRFVLGSYAFRIQKMRQENHRM